MFAVAFPTRLVYIHGYAFTRHGWFTFTQLRCPVCVAYDTYIYTVTARWLPFTVPHGCTVYATTFIPRYHYPDSLWLLRFVVVDDTFATFTLLTPLPPLLVVDVVALWTLPHLPHVLPLPARIYTPHIHTHTPPTHTISHAPDTRRMTHTRSGCAPGGLVRRFTCRFEHFRAVHATIATFSLLDGRVTPATRAHRCVYLPRLPDLRSLPTTIFTLPVACVRRPALATYRLPRIWMVVWFAVAACARFVPRHRADGCRGLTPPARCRAHSVVARLTHTPASVCIYRVARCALPRATRILPHAVRTLRCARHTLLPQHGCAHCIHAPRRVTPAAAAHLRLYRAPHNTRVPAPAVLSCNTAFVYLTCRAGALRARTARFTLPFLPLLFLYAGLVTAVPANINATRVY